MSDVSRECSFCKYKYEANWGIGLGSNMKVTTGDEDFIQINCIGRPFETNKEDEVDYGEPINVEVMLYGCPKCKMIHYEEY